MSEHPLVSVAVPSYNQGKFLEKALNSIFLQDIPHEILVADGGSSDGSLAILQQWSPRLSWWRSHTDKGQASAINEAVSIGSAPYVCWLNSDDLLMPGALAALLESLEKHRDSPAVYGKCWLLKPDGTKAMPYFTSSFSEWMLARRCFIAQPATLIRRSAWDAVGGLDESLHMCLDYDLWWKLYKYGGPLNYLAKEVAATRMHAETKTSSRRADHYREAMSVVRKHYGSVPLKWYIAWPLMVTFASLLHNFMKGKSN
ncbi:MAG: glycosyltransferase [Proteobacteria bacterium]|nr:glycosyltransferase [Pseudomonadota bacterium]MBU0964828.1 glycosyltransferase [Pseudomonadota bacterium]